MGNVKWGSNKQDSGNLGFGGQNIVGEGVILETGCEGAKGRTESFLEL